MRTWINAIDSLKGSNEVNSLSNKEKAELRNMRTADFESAKDNLYYKRVKVGSREHQLGSIIDNIHLEGGKAIFRETVNGKPINTPIRWRSEVWALIQTYLIVEGKMKAGAGNKEIDGIVWPKTFAFLGAHRSLIEKERSEQNERIKENQEKLINAKKAYEHLKKNIFGESLGYQYFPDRTGEFSYYNELGRNRRERYISKFYNKKFCIDKDSFIDNQWRIHLEIDDSWRNEKYHLPRKNPDLIINWWEFWDKTNDKFNTEKFEKKVRQITTNIVNKNFK